MGKRKSKQKKSKKRKNNIKAKTEKKIYNNQQEIQKYNDILPEELCELQNLITINYFDFETDI